ncbi:MAG: polyphosphate:AMP phosphotransferase [Lachnospiraceae bacterium]|nr:polyphosphate:AMP phosphotransferase [Lachnospiraceae bacterium]
MLGQIDVNKTMDKKTYDSKMEQLEVRFGELQRECKEKKIPVMVVFEGLDASGKGTLINRMIQSLDPRGFKVFTLGREKEDEVMRPYFWRFFTKTAERGRMHIFDQSWYKGFYEKDLSEKDVLDFEEMLTEDGTLIVKFFLMISKEEQKKRLDKLQKNSETSWRVTKRDKENNKNYEKCLKKYDRILVHTDTANAPWTVVEATDRLYATCKIVTVMVEKMENAVKEAGKAAKLPTEDTETADHAIETEKFRNGVLQGIDLDKTLTREEYKRKKKELQKRLSILHNKMYLKRVPVILAFEGWDAGGKGGAIKRLTQAMDPRGYEVVPVAAPNDIEKAHHYLWRFWEKIPKAGHMAIFDRTWYGRVLVERIEGFASEKEWSRAYSEINNMEEQFTNAGYIVLKFWMHIDKEEQERRFHERENIPAKQWKITDEDWRNRAKWDEYEKAVDEMIVRTSTEDAPWIVVEANSKYYARIKVLETVVAALEERMI